MNYGSANTAARCANGYKSGSKSIGSGFDWSKSPSAKRIALQDMPARLPDTFQRGTIKVGLNE